MKFIHFCLLSLAFTSIEAAQIIEIDSTNLLRCTFSSRHHNRIAVEDQRIKKIIYPEGDISIRMEEESGQAFVQAMVDNPSVTTVSIVTSEGIVQDLELSFTDKESEILILKGNLVEEGMCLDSLSSIDCGAEIDSIQNAIEGILSGSLPEEYIPVEDREICCRIRRYVTLKSLIRLVGPLYTIHVLILENNGRRKECIHEREINCIAGEWVFLEKNELGRSDKALAFIGVKTYEQE